MKQVFKDDSNKYLPQFIVLGDPAPWTYVTWSGHHVMKSGDCMPGGSKTLGESMMLKKIEEGLMPFGGFKNQPLDGLSLEYLEFWLHTVTYSDAVLDLLKEKIALVICDET